MSKTEKPLKHMVGMPFWIGCLVGPILFMGFLAAMDVFHNSYTFWFSARIAIFVFGPVGGLIFQVIHDLFAASRLRLLRVWDYAVFTAIGVAMLIAGMALFHAPDSVHPFKNRTFDIAVAFVVLLVFVYALIRIIVHFSSKRPDPGSLGSTLDP